LEEWVNKCVIKFLYGSKLSSDEIMSDKIFFRFNY